MCFKSNISNIIRESLIKVILLKWAVQCHEE